MSSDLEAAVQRIFKGERLISRYDGLSAIILRLTPQTVSAPGIYYLILKLLAWEDINVTEVVSTYTEFIILLDGRPHRPRLRHSPLAAAAAALSPPPADARPGATAF